MQATCPKCSHTFNAMRSTHGAAYVRKDGRIGKKAIQILAWWLSNYPDERMTKETIKARFQFVDFDGLNGRISELYAANCLARHGRGVYGLERERAVQVLNNEGRLA